MVSKYIHDNINPQGLVAYTTKLEVTLFDTVLTFSSSSILANTDLI